MDWSTLGLKAGIEIHQQLDTSKKLFCNCKTNIRDDAPDIIVKRKLRAAAGETGELDVAAAYEQIKAKTFIYTGHNESICNVELDEEPICEINQEALEIVLQVALLLKAKPVDAIAVMRKTVVDGSNTSGFQRTALVAQNGTIGNVTIQSVCIEEESAKIVERSQQSDTYNLSRLGIPLVEIATGADMKTPEEVKQVAEYIGMVLRSTGKVKRGLGTIRQDVNVSIAGGTRIEIKGAQELRLIPKYVEYEALRQKGLIEVAAELKKQNAAVGEIVDVTNLFQNCAAEIISSVVAKKGIVLGAKLTGFKGLIGKHFLPENEPIVRLGKEFSGYARAYAGVGGVLHCDELPKYGISQLDVDNLNKTLKCENNDGFVIVAAEKNKAEKGIKAVLERAKQAIKGVSSEVRKANDDGTTTFLRPMPGSSRMYPETDLELIIPPVKKIKLPKLLTEKVGDYQKLGLTSEIAKAVLNGEKSQLFEELVLTNKTLSAAYTADLLLSYPKELSTMGITKEVSEDGLKEIFNALEKSTIAKESAVAAIADAALNGKVNLAKFAILTDEQVKIELKKIVLNNPGLPFNALIGKAMQQLRGKAAGNKIVQLLKEVQ